MTRERDEGLRDDRHRRGAARGRVPIADRHRYQTSTSGDRHQPDELRAAERRRSSPSPCGGSRGGSRRAVARSPVEEPADVGLLVELGRMHVDERRRAARSPRGPRRAGSGSAARIRAAEEQPGEEPEPRGSRDGGAEVAAAGRSRHHQQRDRQHADDANSTVRRPGRRHTASPPRRITAAVSCENVMFPCPDTRIPMVAEYPNTVLSSRRAPATGRHVQDDDEPERERRAGGPDAVARRRDRRRRSARRRRRGTPSTRGRCRSRRSSTGRPGRWRRGTPAPRARTTAPRARPARPRASMSPVASASSTARTSTAVLTPLTFASRKTASSLASMRNSVRSVAVDPVARTCMTRPSMSSRHVDAQEVEHGRRDVDDVHEPGATARRRPQQPG